MVCNTGKLHNDHPHVLDPLRYFDFEQFFHRHMPSHIVDGCRAIVQSVGERSDLIVSTAFSDFLKSPVDIPNCGHTTDNSFSIYLQYVLEHTMSSRMCRPKIQGKKLVLGVIVNKNRPVIRCFAK